jgi:hypothetical protein
MAFGNSRTHSKAGGRGSTAVCLMTFLHLQAGVVPWLWHPTHFLHPRSYQHYPLCRQETNLEDRGVGKRSESGIMKKGEFPTNNKWGCVAQYSLGKTHFTHTPPDSPLLTQPCCAKEAEV